MIKVGIVGADKKETHQGAPMRVFIVLSLTFVSYFSFAEDPRAFEGRIYTPALVTDSLNEGAKGAVQLLWQKMAPDSHYELEVSNGLTTYSWSSQKHFHHIMVYFDKDYRWRVREVKEAEPTAFSDWYPLKVVRAASSVKMREAASEDSYFLDIGDR